VAYFKIFQISIQFSKSIFCSTFPISLWWYGQNFQNSKTKIISSNFKNKKSNFFISNFPCGINDFFFSARDCQNCQKVAKITYLLLPKNSHILHTTPLVVWSTVKELKKERKEMENFRTCKQTSVELWDILQNTWRTAPQFEGSPSGQWRSHR
jgi:hypothetical protein